MMFMIDGHVSRKKEWVKFKGSKSVIRVEKSAPVCYVIRYHPNEPHLEW